MPFLSLIFCYLLWVYRIQRRQLFRLAQHIRLRC